MTVRNLNSTAASTTLTSGCTDIATTIAVAATTGWPSVPFTLIIDKGTTNQEVVTATNVSTLTITITRAQDGTTGVAHLSGAAVSHGFSARDFNAIDPTNVVGTAVVTADSRLSDTRTPTASTIVDAMISTTLSPSKITGTAAVLGANTFTGDQTISTKNIITDGTTGTKLGTATSQKLGLWNATPIVQPSGDQLSALQNFGFGTLHPRYAPGNFSLVTTRGSSAETIALKTGAGNDPSATDPLVLPFRNATAGTADYTYITITAATSITIPSTALMGATNGVPFRVWVVGFNDGGTFRLGVVNCLSGLSVMPLGINRLASSTAMDATSDNAQTFYTGSAVTSKPYIVLGYLDYTLATAGTWVSVPSVANLWRQGDKLPGDVVQTAYVASQDNASTATTVTGGAITSSEGIQIHSAALTPTAAANLLHIHHEGTYSLGNIGENTAAGCGVAILRDSGASSLANANHYIMVNNSVTSTAQSQLSVTYRALAAAAAATTFKARFGPLSAGTANAAATSHLSVTEIMA